MTGSRTARTEADVAVVGSGFAGSLAALALRQMGRSVVLLERGRHPRFAIGESSTPLANILLEELCDRYGLDLVRPLAKWGTWQRQYPHLRVGLKRGFSFFRHDLDRPFTDDRRHRRQLLVAASPHDGIADTHWYRPDVDAWLMERACDAGAEYLDNASLVGIRRTRDGVVIDGTRSGGRLSVRARFVIDASGPRGFLYRSAGLPERPCRFLPPTEALYSHFADVGLFEATPDAGLDEAPPFPVDAAAVHHVFPGGWVWVLRFAHGITSAGAALTAPMARAIRLDEPGAWARLLARLPALSAQFERARAVAPVIHAPQLAFRTDAVVGPRWALLPSAAGVIDPLLSTGFPLTLLGLLRLLRVLEDHGWAGRRLATALSAYEQHTIRELDVTERLVAALYASMEDFEQFKRITRLYFAAASLTETMRRLGRPDRARGFLLCDDPAFGPELLACTDMARRRLTARDRRVLFERIDRAVAPIDVAGLCDGARRDWYPVLAEDLRAAAAKLDVPSADIDALLDRCGFARLPVEAVAGQ
jgi:FADH2 O2-dependent halogenase